MAESSTITTTDEELADLVALRAVRNGAAGSASGAFEQLYQRHARLLLAFLASRVRRADLDDLHQEVWRRVWEHLPNRPYAGSFRGWLHQVARNAALDHARKMRPDSMDENSDPPDRRQRSPEDNLLEQERAAILRRCLDRLDATTASVFRERLGGEDYEAICRKLNLDPAKAHKLFFLAKTQLKACVERALA